MGSLFGGSSGQQTASAPPKVFNKTQASTMSQKYSQMATAKWQQILANMGAGPDQVKAMQTSINAAAAEMAKSLGSVTTGSGFGTEKGSQVVGEKIGSSDEATSMLRSLEAQLRNQGKIQYSLF